MDKKNDDTEKEKNDNLNNKWDGYKALAIFTQLGISMAACVFVGVIAGKLLDGLFGTSPWLLIVFSVIGGIASIKAMYDIVIKGWK